MASQSGYRREKLQILGGGLNLLPSPDKTPKTDYLVAQNFRSDRFGRLVSRAGYQQKFSISAGGIAHSAAVYGGVNGPYYVGVNSGLVAPVGSLYFNFGALPVETGFDGNRIAFAPMNGFMWVMNQAVQGRHSATTGWQPWNLAVPGSSPTAASASGPSTSTSVTYSYTPQASSYTHSLTIQGTTYSFLENGYSAAQLPLVIASLARSDPNATVTFSGSGSSVTITPAIPNVLVQVSGSDGNPATNLANGVVSSLPNGTYTFYVTFETGDESLESNPSPVSNAVTLTNQAVTLSTLPISGDTRMSFTGAHRNVYAIGGTLGQAYLVTTVPDNTSTSWTFSFADLDATNAGIVMPTTNDPPPAAAGMAGPHFSRLFAWNSLANPNRLWYTEPDLPQYWPGSADNSVGNWIDVGDVGEGIVWCTIHTNIIVIYKERSIWMLVGDPSTGYLQRMHDGLGLSGQFAVAVAGASDYFIGPGGLYLFDMNQVTSPASAAAIQPLFTSVITSAGNTLNNCGSVLPGTYYNSNSPYPYAVALGYALGKLYIGYAEHATSGLQYNLLVYHEASGKWFSHRGAGGPVQGFIYDGVQMVALTGSLVGGAAVGLNVDDFQVLATTDPGTDPIACGYQSHYEDAGLPDNEKQWLEIVVDYEFGPAVAGPASSANVYLGLNNATIFSAPIGTLTGIGRQSVSFGLGDYPAGNDGLLAKNLSVGILCSTTQTFTIHNVYLYYYEEARLASSASTLPTDLGIAKVKQVKELAIDLNANGNATAINVWSDLPGNALAVRQQLTSQQNGRALIKFPFPTTEGYLWRVSLTGTDLQLYSVRLLARAIGVYVEAYESAAGFVWDSQEMTFDSGITKIPRQYQIALAALPIKRFREISLEIDTFAQPVTVQFLTDLPGDAQTVQFQTVINSGAVGRRFVRLPLPGGTNPPIEGRMCRLKLSGTSKYILYDAAIEMLAVGVYVEAYEAASNPGAVYDSRQVDLGTPAVKEIRELELDLESTGPINIKLLSDMVASFTTTANTGGRQKVMIPLTINAATEQFIEARLVQLILSGVNAFRLYDARLKVRPFGQYLTGADEGVGGALWDTTDLDLGTQTVKQLREIELDIWAYGPYTVTVYTDLPGNAMASRVVQVEAGTSGRTAVQIPLPQGGVPDNYIFGRLVRVTITSTSSIKLFGGRIHWRPIGVYVETYEAAGGAVWDSTPANLGTPNDKNFDQVRLELDTDGAATLSVYTDLPGEVFTQKGGLFPLTTGATSRHYSTVPLPANTEGRSIRLIASSAAGFRIYKAEVRAGQVGRYLAAAQPAGNDALNTLEFDFQAEEIELFKRLEFDMRADGNVQCTILTDQSGQLTVQYAPILATPNGRQAVSIPFPQGIRGRLLRIILTGTSAARVYHLRLWSRPVNRPDAKWSWVDYPLEETDVLPKWTPLPLAETPPVFQWSDLPVDPTKPEWSWVPLPVNPTEPQWFWGKVLPVEETPNEWTFVEVPFSVTD